MLYTPRDKHWNIHSGPNLETLQYPLTAGSISKQIGHLSGEILYSKEYQRTAATQDKVGDSLRHYVQQKKPDTKAHTA